MKLRDVEIVLIFATLKKNGPRKFAVLLINWSLNLGISVSIKKFFFYNFRKISGHFIFGMWQDSGHFLNGGQTVWSKTIKTKISSDDLNIILQLMNL